MAVAESEPKPDSHIPSHIKVQVIPVYIFMNQILYILEGYWQHKMDIEIPFESRIVKKHRHRRNVTSHHSLRQFQLLLLSSQDNFHHYITSITR